MRLTSQTALLIVLSISATHLVAQNVGIGTVSPNASAALDISSSSKGLLIPRLSTAQRNAIASPAKGLLTYDSSRNAFWYYNGSAWKEVSGNAFTSDSSLVIGSQTGIAASYNLNSNLFLVDSSGYLYDSGGPVGTYGNNENFTCVFGVVGNQFAIDMQVLSNNLESLNDSLFISDSYNHQYVLTGTAVGSFRLFGVAQIRFKSNATVTQPGFAIHWNKIYTPLKYSYDSTQMTGWLFNPSNLYMRGGLNTNNNWSPDSSGRLSFAYGDNAHAGGAYSVVLGHELRAGGSNSFAGGTLNNADGNASFVMGSNNSTTGDYSSAVGYGNSATGLFSSAIGRANSATGYASSAIGTGNSATGDGSTATGMDNSATGTGSIAIGASTTANKDYSFASGLGTFASADVAVAMGVQTKAKSYAGTAIGTYNDTTNAGMPSTISPLNHLFEIGNGTAFNSRSNAMTVLQNGNVGLGLTNPTSTLELRGAIGFSSLSAKWELGFDNVNSYFYVNEFGFNRRLFIKTGGNVGIGVSNPPSMLTVATDLRLDNNNTNNGDLSNSLYFGSFPSGEGIASKRTASGNQDGLDFYTNFINRMSVTNAGNVGIGLTNPLEKLQVAGNAKISGNILVQNNFGIVRTNTATQLKTVTTNVAINYTSSPIGAGSTVTQAITWSESFSSAPTTYIGNVTSGGGGWAEVVLTITNTSNTGAILYIYNPKGVAVTPVYNINIIAIGGQ